MQPGDVITAVNGQWVYNDEFVYDQTKALKAMQDDPVAFNKLVTALQKKIDGSVSLSDAQTKLDDPAAKTISLTVTRAGAAQPLALTLDTSAPTVVPADRCAQPARRHRLHQDRPVHAGRRQRFRRRPWPASGPTRRA